MSQQTTRDAIPNDNNTIPPTPSLFSQDITDMYDLNINDLKGTGAFSKVITARCRSSGHLRALKVMERQYMYNSAGVMGMVLHEKEILRRVNHCNIVKLHRFVQTDDEVFFELDLMDGDLFEYVMRAGRLTEGDTATIMRQLLQAVAYIHDLDVVHRDIKPENILINTPNDIKLADFGLAKVVEGWEVRSTPCGSSFYIAPEVIRSIEAQGATPLTTTRDEIKMVDIWSCGVVMFVLLAGRPPFSGQVRTPEERRRLLRRIDRGVLFKHDVWTGISDTAKDLILRLLSQEVRNRFTAREALQHGFFREGSVCDGKNDNNVDNIDNNNDIENDNNIVENTDNNNNNNNAPSRDIESHNCTRAELDMLHIDLLETGDTEGNTSHYCAAPIVNSDKTVTCVKQKQKAFTGIPKGK
eukprot:Tbor_TRINITY_DN5331_c2_g10::TRINITY_DN5331_c2_g10_i1::g.4747::m.4747